MLYGLFLRCRMIVCVVLCLCSLFVLDCVMLYEGYLIVLWSWCVLFVIRCVVLRGVCCVFVFVFAYGV